MKEKLYKISTDTGHSFSEQWMTESEKESMKMTHKDWLIIESHVTPIKIAVAVMKRWINYEKKHKDEINRADDLIDIQETILNYMEAQEQAIYKILERLNNKENEMNAKKDDHIISEQIAEAYLSGLNHARVIIQEEIDFIKGGSKHV